MNERRKLPAGESSSSAAVEPARAGNFDLQGFLAYDQTVARAEAGVAGAGSPLPHGEAIQRAFGRHDVSGITAAVGGEAAAASEAMGANAYAYGDRVAFAAAPELHLAAHEAAHVVQQRRGVQLQGGVGRSGDAYEQHADRVADLVVRGESAEAELDRFAGGGGQRAVQRHDSPGHIAIGDSVHGDSVWIHGVEFTPGQLAALTDYIGDVHGITELEAKYQRPDVVKMKELLVRGIEDVLPWDEATGGKYSTEAQSNEHHFAPAAGDGGANFRDRFIELYRDALAEMKPKAPRPGKGGMAPGPDVPDPAVARANALLLLYSAEHYLQDAFSAGHQIASRHIQIEVDEIFNIPGEAWAAAPDVGRAVWASVGDMLSTEYATRDLGGGTRALDEDTFVAYANLGGLVKGAGGVNDAIRRAVHEQLAEQHVMVTSEAHPQPFELLGDHDIDQPAAAEGVAALQLAIAEAREGVDRGASVEDPQAAATRLFDRHCPVPTAHGQQLIRETLERTTRDKETIIAHWVETMVDTIHEVMGFLELQTHGLVYRVHQDGGTRHEIPTLPPAECEPNADV